MTVKRRWVFGSYIFTYNPNSFDWSLKETNGITTGANGIISSTNNYYITNIGIKIDLYNKPTSFGSVIKSITSGYYSSLSEKRTSEELFCLRGKTVDVVSKSGVLNRSFNVDLASGSNGVAITHLDTNVAIFYANGSLVICDENGVQISKYTYTDQDIMNIVSLTYNTSSQLIYGLSKYGKVFSFSSGISSLAFQFPDYSTSTSKYISIHCKDNFYGIYSTDGFIKYLDSNYEICYSISDIFGIVDISYSNYSGDFIVLSPVSIEYFMPNICGLDIVSLENEIPNGVVLITDENMNSFYFAPKSMSVDRKKNKNESRYEVSIEGIKM